ncbi:putative ABC transporter [Ixodes scapularis]
MSRVEEAQISLQNKASLKPVPIDLFIRQFPRPSLPQDEPAVFSHMSLSTSLLVLGFAGPFLFRVSSVVNENSAEMKWIQLSQGLHELAHWLGQFGTCLAFTLLDSLVAVLCLLYVNTESSLPAFEKTDVTLLAFVFFLFSCMFTLHVVLFACFFRTRAGVSCRRMSRPWWLVLKVPVKKYERALVSLSSRCPNYWLPKLPWTVKLESDLQQNRRLPDSPALL